MSVPMGPQAGVSDPLTRAEYRHLRQAAARQIARRVKHDVGVITPDRIDRGNFDTHLAAVPDAHHRAVRDGVFGTVEVLRGGGRHRLAERKNVSQP